MQRGELGRAGNTVDPDGEQLLRYTYCLLNSTPPSMLFYLFCFSIIPLLLCSFHITNNVHYSIAMTVWLKIELDLELILLIQFSLKTKTSVISLAKK